MQTQVLSRARPIRIAFLVELEEASHPILDAVFEAAFGIWGGRFSLIVPCENGVPLPAFLPWLASFDADLIYAYVDLDPEQQVAFHETYYPSALQRHAGHRVEMHPSFAPQLSLSPLSVGTLLPLAGAPGWIDGRRGARILGAMGTIVKDRFLHDSFGFATTPLRNQIRGTLSDSASVVVAIAEGEILPRQTWVHGAETTLPDANAILSAMADDKRLLGVARLSAMQAPRLDTYSPDWSRSFNIVVGDTVADRILYWNARALMSPYNDSYDVDLHVPPERFEDETFLTALRRFLNERNYLNGDGNGPPRATLRSISLDQKALSDLKMTLASKACWTMFDERHIASIDTCVPDQDSLARANFMVGDHGLRHQGWQESYAAGDDIRLTAPEPEHLRHIPSALASPASGQWAVDLDMERTVDHSPYDNLRHRWQLPRRLRTTRSFLLPYRPGGAGNGSLLRPRVSTGGLLTVFAAAGASLPKIAVPTDETAIGTALMHGRDWDPFVRPPGYGLLPQLCVQATRSGAGRQFWGVYQLFGGINAAKGVLLHEFWRNQLDAYGATGGRVGERLERIALQLKKRVLGTEVDLTMPDNLTRLSNIVLQQVDEEAGSQKSISWSRFERDFATLLARFDEANPPEPSIPDLREEEQRYRQESLRRSVQALCQREILHQGYEHKCRKCLHRGWIGIATLGSVVTCEICGDQQPAPVDRPWDFRLNGFLHDALQRHGIGPLFWVLGRLQRHKRGSFWFEGPMDIYFDEESLEARRPATDVDLTIVDEGVVKMCEVKQSARQFREPGKMATNLARLRPDVAIIAVMEPETQAIRDNFARFSEALRGTGVKPELMTLDPEEDITTGPWFADV